MFKQINSIQDKYEVWTIDDNTLGLILKNSRKHKKLNEYLRQYPEDTEFSSQDEALFKIKLRDVSVVSEITGINFNIFVLR